MLNVHAYIQDQNLEKMYKLSSLIIFFFLLFLHFATSSKNFTSTFFFGDSTLDTGNNKFIPTPFKANHFPYGLDYPSRIATGRFSNGLLVPDMLTSYLGIKPLSPPYLDPNLSIQELRTGVNFASAGSGLDDITSAVTKTVPISGQLEYFEEYLERMKSLIGEEEIKRIVSGGLIMFSSGANDVIFNYYDLPSRRREEYNISGYHDFLHGILKDAVKRVYHHGGRSFIVAGLPPTGCLPIQITAKHPMLRRCDDDQISDAAAYNSKLQKLLSELQRSLPGSKIVYLDTNDNMLEIIKNPMKYGFDEAKRGCCGTGMIEIGPLCNQLCMVCNNMSSFVFFDAIHPSERVYKVVAEHIMKNVIPHLY